MKFLRLNYKTNSFEIVEDRNIKSFPGTVKGAIEMIEYCSSLNESVQMSSDLNHPEDYPNFDKYSIDIAAGYYEEAIRDSIITLK